MKEKYKTPELKVIFIDSEDIITSSIPIPGENELPFVPMG